MRSEGTLEVLVLPLAGVTLVLELDMMVTSCGQSLVCDVGQYL